MIVGDGIQVSLEAIRANKLRSALTMLGIVIGVGAVITMVALGSGAQKSVQDRLQAMGPNLLTVYAGQSFSHGVASANRVSLTMDDDTTLANNARYITAVVPELPGQMQVQYGSTNLNLRIVGTSPDYVTVRNYTLTAGRMFSAGENAARRRLAVVGASVPEQLGANPVALVGQQIQLRGIEFTVAGVLSEKGSQGSWSNPDEQILIPIDTARYRVMGTDRLASITVAVGDMRNVNLAMIEIERWLRRQHKIRPGQPNDFQIRNQSDILATFEQTTQTFTFLLAGIAAVSLLVGGIGIMNIMLVSVTERTREIGIRMALGARRSDILSQFLVEALVLCLFGGLFGVLFGVGGAVVLSRLAHWNTLVSPGAIALSLVFSAGVGVTFGIWPARRAAALDPIEALRYE
ncbi:MAG: multidrug ABC transporter substrate-binding protein [Candidatus Eisenbacteria bacterium RBG_16_71_46]|nr:MAG: multidrug ABC transporter substrate-binding protein [Candidatus Eisenbacteria bacterium RBG_16_71_46]